MDLKISKPLTLKSGLTFPNRLAKAAMAEYMATPEDLPNERHDRVYGKWAEGNWGMILTGNVQVDTAYLGGAGDLAVQAQLEEKAVKVWKQWADANQKHGTPAIVQLNHPGRQSPFGAGKRSFFTKTLAPSPIAIDLGGNILGYWMQRLIFGTPKEMSVEEIQNVVDRFASSARLASESGFSGVQLHGAHGYLLAQFLSPRTNKRTDDYGGSPTKRAKLIVDIIEAIRKSAPPSFTVGIKLNSVDHQSAEELKDCIEQIRLIEKAGIDFLEISGGTYENPTMAANGSTDEEKPAAQVSARTAAREAFFLDFSKAIRSHFPELPLMVTGGFRTRKGMEDALQSDACDIIGIGRPAALNPHLPRDIIFNPTVKDEEARVSAPEVAAPVIAKIVGIKMIGAGAQTVWYSKQIQQHAKGL